MSWDQLWSLLSWSIISVSCASNYFLFWQPIFPLIVIVVVAIGFGCHYFAAFHRASAREMKRLGVYFMSTRMTIFWNSYSHFADSMLRSLLYSHLSESLTGQIRSSLWHLSLIFPFGNRSANYTHIRWNTQIHEGERILYRLGKSCLVPHRDESKVNLTSNHLFRTR